jgi:hypothetical protein
MLQCLKNTILVVQVPILLIGCDEVREFLVRDIVVFLSVLDDICSKFAVYLMEFIDIGVDFIVVGSFLDDLSYVLD